jgi:hypothetical protein
MSTASSAALQGFLPATNKGPHGLGLAHDLLGRPTPSMACGDRHRRGLGDGSGIPDHFKNSVSSGATATTAREAVSGCMPHGSPTGAQARAKLTFSADHGFETDNLREIAMGKLQALACVLALMVAAAIFPRGATAAPVNGLSQRPWALPGEKSIVLVYCRGRHCDDDDDDYPRRRYYERRSYARFDGCRSDYCGYGGYGYYNYRARPYVRWYGYRADYDWDSSSSGCGKYRYSIGEHCADARYYPPFEAPDW